MQDLDTNLPILRYCNSKVSWGVLTTKNIMEEFAPYEDRPRTSYCVWQAHCMDWSKGFDYDASIRADNNLMG